jgi:hypothetical protein
MNERPSDERLVALTLEGLERSTVPPNVADRLAATRRAAVERVDRPVPAPLGAWVPAGAMATTLIAVGLLVVEFSGRDVPLPVEEVQAVQHLDLLEDIELFAWMVEQDASRGAG